MLTTGWRPGNYLFRLDAASGSSYVPLTVRSPCTEGRLLLLAPDTTWQAYNDWGVSAPRATPTWHQRTHREGFLLTINLSPATLPKAGSHYDLSIVAAVLAAQNVFRREGLRHTALLGELELDGRVRPGALHPPGGPGRRADGVHPCHRSARPGREAHLVEGIEVLGVVSISQLVALLRGDPVPEIEPIEVTGDPASGRVGRQLDLAAVVGQVEAKWACEVAAAGRHDILLSGPPGVGKTMLAERVPSLLTRTMPSRCRRCTRWRGSTSPDQLITRPPYSDPHHSPTMASMVGGGPRLAKPGAISVAHPSVVICR